MEFKQLEAFVNVVKLGSFSKAADLMFLTQPTVSTHIGSLEKQLGVQLIIRTPKEAYPTKIGKTLYEHALNILMMRDNAVKVCEEHREQVAGRIDIAASTIPYKYLLPRLMTDFRKHHPDVVFTVEDSDTGGVIDAVMRGDRELGMVGAISDCEKCAYLEYMDDELVVITPNTPDFGAFLGDSFLIEDICKYPYIIREPGSGTRQEAEKILRDNGINPAWLNVVAQLDNPDAVKHSVSQGLGISIVSQMSVADYEQFYKLRVFHLQGIRAMRKLYFVHHKSRVLSLAAQTFVQFAMSRRREAL